MARFPPYEAEADEPPADPRTNEERNRARGQLLLLEAPKSVTDPCRKRDPRCHRSDNAEQSARR
jgi:hypothetical protein